MEGGLGKRGGNAWAARLLDPRRHPPQREQPESVHLQASLLDIELMPASDPLSKYPPLLDSVRWASGFPRLDLKSKDSEHGLASGAQLPLYRENVTVLRDYVLSMPAEAWQEEEQRKTNAWLAGRSSNLNEFKPGTSSIHLLFSDQSGDTVFEFPWWKYRFGRLINPILDRILGADKANVIRLQLALMPGGTHIKAHIDKGGYSSEGHRIHVVVASSPEVSFHVCEVETCVPLHVEEGLVFELNNRLRHYVHNDGETPRVHLVVDVAESPRTRTRLHAGQVCDYTNGRIVC